MVLLNVIVNHLLFTR